LLQQHDQAQRENIVPKIPLVLSKVGEKNYNQIFKAWDVQPTRFISGQTALEVFGQSKLEKNDLARIRTSTMSPNEGAGLISIVKTLTDADNRGKLNMAIIFCGMLFVHFCYRPFGSVSSRTKWPCYP
jgi:hypothetical protein